MLTYKQRYKPRTTREYTKSDLTVYDSAGNTALNALTVYGKSEVVDGAIKSAGEGYAVVRLADLTWGYQSSQKRFFAEMSNSKQPTDINALANIFTNKYKLITFNELVNNLEQNKAIAGIQSGSASAITIRDTDYTAVSDFVTSLGDATLCYQLADPTQGNTIAIKTDDGSGINGTMATFTTGTPLRGITGGARDVMAWDGSRGEVTKNCGKVRLADLTWSYRGEVTYGLFSATLISPAIQDEQNIICAIYTYGGSVNGAIEAGNKDNKTLTIYKEGTLVYIKDTDYTTKTDFVASLGDAELVYELAAPTTQPLSSTENASIAGLRTFDGTTHFTNNATTDMTVNYTIKIPTIS